MAQWKQDPQNRENIEEVTKELELPIFKPNALGKFRPWLKEAWSKIEDYLLNLKEIANSKEPAISKKTGFNLDKTDEYTLDDTNKLATGRALKRLFDEIVRRIGAIRLTWEAITGKPSFSSSVNSTAENQFATPKAVKTAYDKGVEALNTANTKEPAIIKKTGFNLDLGTIAGTVLEGDKINQIVGKNYGGILNVSGRKSAGLTYFDNNTKKLFLCKDDNYDTSASVDNYIALDNNSLLERLENLIKNKLVHHNFNGKVLISNNVEIIDTNIRNYKIKILKDTIVHISTNCYGSANNVTTIKKNDINIAYGTSTNNTYSCDSTSAVIDVVKGDIITITSSVYRSGYDVINIFEI